MSVETRSDGKNQLVPPDPDPLDEHDITCPHCRKRFHGDLLPGSAARYVGFKCPFCKLFVPLARVEEQPASAPARGRA